MSIDAIDLRNWLAIPTSQLPDRARVPVTIVESPRAVHERCAQDMFDEIVSARNDDRALRVIVPIGPTAQYPLLAAMVNNAGISLERVTYYGMDQSLDWQGRPVPAGHPFDFEASFHALFVKRLNLDLRPPADHVIFPSPFDLERSARDLEASPADTCYAGIGFNGHLAFNEPPCSPFTKVTLDELRNSTTRILSLRTDTLLSQAHRKLGGNVYDVPPMGVTLGLRELLSAKRLRLYTDGGAWKQTIMRILLFAEPTVEFPVTLAQLHADVHVVLDAVSATPPEEALWAVEASAPAVVCDPSPEVPAATAATAALTEVPWRAVVAG
jgi:glucosamine-6-phosphate deaminase